MGPLSNISKPESLLDHLRDLIVATGAISVANYMQIALGHPRWGYYRTRDPLGRNGDFTTAPEISQMFGEMLGLWAVTVWQRLGQPNVFRLIEMGPGRGTLIADALRVVCRVPGFNSVIRLHMVETSPVLAAKQQEVLNDFNIPKYWHTRLTDIPNDEPICLIANELLDALPVRQVVFHDGAWHERLVDWNQKSQALILRVSETPLSPQPKLPEGAMAGDVFDGSIMEIAILASAIVRDVADLILAHNGAALFIDYGHDTGCFGDTLQAIRGHKYAHVLDSPGSADLTTHVDFAHLARVAQEAGLHTYGTITQGQFLRSLGIGARAQKLLSIARSAQQRRDILSAHVRLVSPNSMGGLFKVMALTSPDFGAPEGFA